MSDSVQTEPINPIHNELVEKVIQSSLIQTEAKYNPLLEKVKMPGKIFQLPSRGLMYTNGELADTVMNGEVHVHPLSGISEIKSKNADMLYSGRAFEEIIKECVPEVNKPKDLFGRDVDALMCFIRMVTYGNVFQYEVKHDCRDSKDHKYDVNVETDIINKMSYLDPTTLNEKYSTDVVFDSGEKQRVQLEPMRLKHIIDMLQETNRIDGAKLTAEMLQAVYMQNLLSIINNVDSVTDKTMITQWLSILPVAQLETVSVQIQKTSDFGPTFNVDCTCKDCGAVFSVDVPINPITFFSR